MGRTSARNLRDNFPEVELAAWVDVIPGAAEAAIESGGMNAAAFTDLNDAIRATDAEILIDVTVPEAHAEVTIAGLEGGLDVIVEKPIATSMADARRMVETAARTGRTLMVSQSRRFDPNLEVYRGLIQRELGGVEYLTADFFIGAHFGGFRDEMASVLLLDMAIHTFDQARALLERDAISVYAEEFNPSWSWFKGASGAVCLFEMEGGVRFEYRGLWSAEGFPTSWQASWRAVGAQGTALGDRAAGVRAEVVTVRGGFHSEVRPIHPLIPAVDGGIRGSFAEFLAARREGREPCSSARTNLNSLAMVLGAVESSRKGHRVRID